MEIESGECPFSAQQWLYIATYLHGNHTNKMCSSKFSVKQQPTNNANVWHVSLPYKKNNGNDSHNPAVICATILKKNAICFK